MPERCPPLFGMTTDSECSNCEHSLYLHTMSGQCLGCEMVKMFDELKQEIRDAFQE